MAELADRGRRPARRGLGEVHLRAVDLVAPRDEDVACGRDRRAGDRHPAARVDVLGRTERARRGRAAQLQAVARAQRHVLGAVGQRDGAAVADDDPGCVARVAGEEPRRVEALPGGAQRRPHGGPRGRAPCRGGVAARPDRDGHARAAWAAHEGRERLRRAEAARVPARASRPPGASAARRGGGTTRRPPRRWGRPPTPRSLRGPPARTARPAWPSAPPGPNATARTLRRAPRALDDDHAAAVGGDARVDRRGRRRSSASARARAERRARRAGAGAWRAARSPARARAHHEGASVAGDGQARPRRRAAR